MSDNESDDNYSYDDEADHAERLSVFRRLEEKARSARKGRKKATAFDLELHDLLAKLGDTEDGIDECVLRQEFEAMDADGNGSLDVVELSSIFDKLGIQVKPYKLMNLLSLADVDQSDSIEWPEFKKIIGLGLRWNAMLKKLGADMSNMRGPVLEYQLKQEFEKIDVDGNGSLDRHELQQVFDNLSVPCDAETVEQMMAMADKDGNGSIEWEEFRKLFHVMSTVSRMTRPRKEHRKALRREELFASGGSGRRRAPRPSCVEWQTIISSVSQQLQQKKVPINDKTLKKEFERIDTSRDGSLDVSELAAMFTDMGIKLDSGQVENLVVMADDDRSQTIEWPEFRRMFVISMKWHEFLLKVRKSIDGVGPLTDAVLRRQFLMIDTDGSGSISRQEMTAVFANLGVTMDNSMVTKLLILTDGDGSGEIEWPEFKRMFQIVRQLADHQDKNAHRFR